MVPIRVRVPGPYNWVGTPPKQRSSETRRARMAGGKGKRKQSSTSVLAVTPLQEHRGGEKSAPKARKVAQEDMGKKSTYGFTITSEEEEERLENIEGRIVANYDFDDDFLHKIGFHSDMYKLLGNIGWVQFALNGPVSVRKDVVVEMFVTMKKVMRCNEEGDAQIPWLSFRIKDEEKMITFEGITELLGFNPQAPEFGVVEADDLKDFWNNIAKEDNRQRKNICNPILQIFHFWMSRRILGRMNETKVTDAELNWLYCAVVGKQVIDPSYMMISRWLAEATSGCGAVGSGCYLTMIASFLKPDIEKLPEWLIRGGSIDARSMKHAHLIGGEEEKGYIVGGTNLRLPDRRLGVFLAGKSNWREEGILIPAKKDKRGNRIGDASSSSQAEQPYHGSINETHTVLCGPFEKPYQGRIPSTTISSQFKHLPQPQRGTRIIGAYVQRNLQDVDIMRQAADRIEEGNLAIAYQLGLMGIAPPENYQGGGQECYERGFYEHQKQGVPHQDEPLDRLG